MQTFETGLLDLTAISLGELRVLHAPGLDSAIAGERRRAEHPDEGAVQLQEQSGFGIPA